MFQCDPITTADVVLLVSTVILAGAAFLAPYWVSRRREKELAPKLVAVYKHEEPIARRSAISFRRRPDKFPVYDLHFLVRNTGRSPARKVVAVVVEFWHEDSGVLIKKEDFMPVPLRYASEVIASNEVHSVPVEFVDVHPGRPYYWNIGRILSKGVWKKLWSKDSHFGVSGNEPVDMPFLLDLYNPPYDQVDAFPKGVYGIKVVLYLENVKPPEILLVFEWNEEWKDIENEMLEQIKIKQEKSLVGNDIQTGI